MSTCPTCSSEQEPTGPAAFWSAMAIYGFLCFAAPMAADTLAPAPWLDTLLRAVPFILLAFVLPIVSRGPCGKAPA